MAGGAESAAVVSEPCASLWALSTGAVASCVVTTSPGTKMASLTSATMAAQRPPGWQTPLAQSELTAHPAGSAEQPEAATSTAAESEMS